MTAAVAAVSWAATTDVAAAMAAAALSGFCLFSASAEILSANTLIHFLEIGSQEPIFSCHI